MKKRVFYLIFLLFVVLALLFSAYSKKQDKYYFYYDLENCPEVLGVEKMIDNTGVYVPSAIKKKIAIAISENARYYEIKPEKLVAIAYVESRFNPRAHNKATDDIGLCQINWFTWKNRFTRNKDDLFNVFKNVETACKIININKNMGFHDISNYHSFTEEHREIYRAKIQYVLRRI